MTIVTHSDGDVYMIRTDEGIKCLCKPDAVFKTMESATEHILLHCLANDKAPYMEILAMLANTDMKIIDDKAVYSTVEEE